MLEPLSMFASYILLLQVGFGSSGELLKWPLGRRAVQNKIVGAR